MHVRATCWKCYRCRTGARLFLPEEATRKGQKLTGGKGNFLQTGGEGYPTLILHCQGGKGRTQSAEEKEEERSCHDLPAHQNQPRTPGATRLAFLRNHLPPQQQKPNHSHLPGHQKLKNTHRQLQKLTGLIRPEKVETPHPLQLTLLHNPRQQLRNSRRNQPAFLLRSSGFLKNHILLLVQRRRRSLLQRGKEIRQKYIQKQPRHSPRPLELEIYSDNGDGIGYQHQCVVDVRR